MGKILNGLFSSVTGALGGWQGYAAAAGLAALLAAGGTYYVTSLGYRLTISRMHEAQTDANLKAANESLTKFAANADRIAGAADTFLSVKSALDTRFATLNRSFADAIRQSPLPADCKPDAVRVQSLSAAVAAANSAAGSHPRPAVPPSQ